MSVRHTGGIGGIRVGGVCRKTSRPPGFSHVCWIPDLGLFQAGGSHEGLAVFRRGPVWIDWPVCVTDPG